MTSLNDTTFSVLAWEIFTHMTAKSIFKLATTCQQCLNFLKDISFCKRQANNMMSREDCEFFIQTNWIHYFAKENVIKLLSLTNQQLSHVIQPQSMEFLRDVQVLVSSGGLLFCRNTQMKYSNLVEPFVIINPATAMKVEVCAPSGLTNGEMNNVLKVVFHYNKNGDPFLMIIMTQDKDDWNSLYKCMIYSFEEKEWREKSQRRINIGSRSLSVKNHVLFGECVYFLSDFSCSYTPKSEYYFPYILCYNIENEETHLLRLPSRANKGSLNHLNCHCQLKIFSWNKCKTMCLVMFRKGLFTIWVWDKMIKKGEEQWVQILRKSGLGIRLLENGLSNVAGFTVINGKTLVVVLDNKRVYSYNLMSNQKTATLICENHRCRGRDFTMYSYSNTLAQIPKAVPLFP